MYYFIKKVALFLIYFSSVFCYLKAQELPPLPPPAPKESNGEKTIEVGSVQKLSDRKTEKIKIIEAKNSTSKSSDNDVCKVQKFDIESKLFTNKKSKYYHKTIEEKLNSLDLSISEEEIIALTKYHNSLKIDPLKIDSLAGKIYKLNNDAKYEEALKVCEELKKMSPNNITLHKELSLAYNKLGKQDLCEKHFEMMKKILQSIMKYSDGCRENPFILNNFFEGLSLYEATVKCFPSKTRFILTESKKMIVGYDCFHIMRFADLNHYKNYLKEGDYKVE